MSIDEQNMNSMQTLDDSWNARDWDTFAQLHKPDLIVCWPGQPPTHEKSLNKIKYCLSPARAVVRRGEFSPYANVILVSGVVF